MFALYQYSVLREMTASRSGMTSREKYPPRSNICSKSFGMMSAQILQVDQRSFWHLSVKETHLEYCDVTWFGPGERTL